MSVFAAFAASRQLILARALLGLFGATLMPSTLALLRMFADPVQRRLAVAIWAMASHRGRVGTNRRLAAGALLVGLDLLINVPVIGLFLVLAPLLLPGQRTRHREAGLFNTALSIATMFLVVFGIKSVAAGDALYVALGLFASGVLLSWILSAGSC